MTENNDGSDRKWQTRNAIAIATSVSPPERKQLFHGTPTSMKHLTTYGVSGFVTSPAQHQPPIWQLIHTIGFLHSASHRVYPR